VEFEPTKHFASDISQTNFYFLIFEFEIEKVGFGLVGMNWTKGSRVCPQWIRLKEVGFGMTGMD
jgi:hypothetical protein